jgi:hypothetical protein
MSDATKKAITIAWFVILGLSVVGMGLSLVHIWLSVTPAGKEMDWLCCSYFGIGASLVLLVGLWLGGLGIIGRRK